MSGHLLRALSALAGAVMVCSLAGCDRSPSYDYDLCRLLHTERFEPLADGAGSIRVLKDGELTTSSSAWVSPDSGAVTVNSCMTNGHETWSLLTNWYFAQEREFPLELEVINMFTHEDVSSFVGWLEICDRQDCHPGRVVSVFNSFRGFLPSYAGSGQVVRYDPIAGVVTAKTKFENYSHEKIEIEIDITWQPLPDAGLDPIADAGPDDASASPDAR